MIRALITFWQFTRPHTIIGSALSVTALYVLVLARPDAVPDHFGVWLPSLISALACNVFITGLNQWSDVEVDRINKPWLPIPAGRLSRAGALRIVLVCLVLALLVAALLSWSFFGLIALISLLGWAYSMPPIQLKRHHFGAALVITVVRGILVNLGFYSHYRAMLSVGPGFDPVIAPLTAFVALFSIGIAWFKDIPDTRGDAEFRFGTLAVRMGRSTALLLGAVVVGFAYLSVLLPAWIGLLPHTLWYTLTFGIPLAVFVLLAVRLNVDEDALVKRFYLFFWGLFFLAYVLYPMGLW
jgi:homogentisate phytyltransferase/homogentisate geranylgeranyltransferase